MHFRFLPCALLLAALRTGCPRMPGPAAPADRAGQMVRPCLDAAADQRQSVYNQRCRLRKPLICRCRPGAVYKVTPSATGITLTRTALADGEMPTQPARPRSPSHPTGTDYVQIARLDTKGPSLAVHWHRYRGSLTVRRDPDNTLRVINTVGLEPYLYGVIPAEIGTNVPLEAMRAQAVAARTYALKNRGKFASEGFDLDDTTRSEGYLGVDGETPLSNAAVDSTRGQVLTWHGQLIDAPYSTDSGGMTACDTERRLPLFAGRARCPAAQWPGLRQRRQVPHLEQKYSPPPKLQPRLPKTHVPMSASLFPWLWTARTLRDGSLPRRFPARTAR